MSIKLIPGALRDAGSGPRPRGAAWKSARRRVTRPARGSLPTEPALRPRDLRRTPSSGRMMENRTRTGRTRHPSRGRGRKSRRSSGFCVAHDTNSPLNCEAPILVGWQETVKRLADLTGKPASPETPESKTKQILLLRTATGGEEVRLDSILGVAGPPRWGGARKTGRDSGLDNPETSDSRGWRHPEHRQISEPFSGQRPDEGT